MPAPLRLQLDPRRIAMLRAMGLSTLWMPKPAQPSAAAPSAPTAALGSLPQSKPQPAPQPSPSAAQQTAFFSPQPIQPDANKFDANKPISPISPASNKPDVAALDWAELEQAVATCQACALCNRRSNTVFGTGDPQASIFVLGEAPGEQEDIQGQPFVGPAGKLLDQIFLALPSLGPEQTPISRKQHVYISNTLKCRPPANRNPAPEEIAQCAGFWQRQIELVQPKVIMALGRFAVQTLLQSSQPIGQLRGRIHRYGDIPVVVSYHPAYLLRAPADKAKAWSDWCLLLEQLA